MSNPRKHHYLPQFYLRGFSVDQRTLLQIEKQSLKHYPGQIKDVAAIRDFHEIDGDDVSDPQAIEKHLAQLESLMAQDLCVVLKDGLVDPVRRSGLIEFLSLMRMRVPAVKAHIQRSLSSVLRAQVMALQKLGKLPPPPPGFEEALKVENLDLSVMNWKCLEKMFKFAGNRDALINLNGMRATLFRAPTGSTFITSDQPVAVYHPDSVPDVYILAGPETPGAEVSLPLSRDVLLMLDNEEGADAEREATQSEVQEFNRRTAIMATEYIFVGEDAENTIEMVRPLIGEFAGFDFENFESPGELVQVLKFIPVGPAGCS